MSSAFRNLLLFVIFGMIFTLVYLWKDAQVGLDELHEKLDTQRHLFEQKLGESEKQSTRKEQEIENVKAKADELERRLNAVQQERDEESAKCKAENESFHADKSVLAERVRGLEDKVKATKATTNAYANAKIAGAKEALLSIGQALYSNAPASFERIEDGGELNKEQSCYASSKNNFEIDIEESESSVQRYEVFVNPGRPIEESKGKETDSNITMASSSSSCLLYTSPSPRD